jgi:hypothetical protein
VSTEPTDQPTDQPRGLKTDLSNLRARPKPGGPLDLAAAADLRVDDSDDDDPVLYYADGSPVDTWREDTRTTSASPAPNTNCTSACCRSSC